MPDQDRPQPGRPAHPGRTERGPRPSRRRILLAGGVGAAALLVGGVAILDRAGVVDMPLPGPQESPAERAAAAVSDRLAALPDLSDRVPDLTVEDLAVSGVAVSLLTVPGARGVDSAVDVCAAKILREAAFRGGAPEDPTSAAPGTAAVAIVPRVVAVGSGMLGILLDASDDEGPSPVLIWYVAEADRGVLSPALIAEESWGAFADAVVAAAAEIDDLDSPRDDDGADGSPGSLRALLQQQPRPYGNGPALLPRADGGIDAIFPSVLVGGEGAPLLVPLAPEAVAGLLSAEGDAVAAAIAQGDGTAFDPSLVTIPASLSDEPPLAVEDPRPPRTPADGARGPRTQLAPAAEPGRRPYVEVGPDLGRLSAVALTFDDGPSEDLNGTLRTHLREAGAAATFFMIGKNVEGAPAAAAATCAEGHELAGHSWDHADLTTLSGDALDAQISRTADALAEATGRRPLAMRAPYGASDHAVTAAAGAVDAVGESLFGWDLDTLDWKTLDAQKTEDAIAQGTQRGTIALMHEIHEESVAAVPACLAQLAADGRTLVTCEELGAQRWRAGHSYWRGLVHGVGY
ncbi:polysaccharide deacetylase family protein [Brachybacterium sp. DNPG3]